MNEDDLRQLATDAARRAGAVGAQVAVLHGDRLLQAETGLARIDTAQPVTPDTLFQIGSTTKLHAAVLLMQLVDEGRVALDAPVSEQLPGFSLASGAATASVTPRHLMSMSSGIDNGPYVFQGRGDDALQRYVAALQELPLAFASGTGFGYSNASTCVTGRLTEHVTGQCWEDVLRDRLLEPAGLQDTTTWTDEVIVRRHALGHAVGGDGTPQLLRSWCLPRAMGPAGSTACATATDLARLAGIFLHEGLGQSGQRLLEPATVKEMQSAQVAVPPTLLADFWGLGPYGTQWQGEVLLGHSGTNLSGSSYVLWAPERDLAVATTVNTPARGYPFAQAVFTEVFGSLGSMRPPERPRSDPSIAVDVARLVGTYEMSDLRLVVRPADGDGLTVSMDSRLFGTAAPSRLLPLTTTTFLPTDPALDGGRGWALAFLGADHSPATHLLNGLFCLRRTS